MTIPFEFEQVVHRIDPRSRLLRAWKLEGGVSAQVTALEVKLCDGQTKKMVVRQHGSRDFAHNPRIAADEFRLLQLLHTAGVPAPEPYYLDQSNEIFSTPYLVMEYIEGRSEFMPTDLSDFLLQSATQLFRIHQIDATGEDLSFLPRLEERYRKLVGARPLMVDDSLDEGRIRDALEAAWPLPQCNAPVLLHGDFWPGNLLWRDERLMAIIDWEDAGLGDPLIDLANSRLELLWAFGSDAMQRFTQLYQAHAPDDSTITSTINYTELPYWDLCAALRPVAQMAQWGLDETTERTMRERHRWFVNQALEKLSHMRPMPD